jgi:4-carboxymuconolactone decarboxylase
MDRTVQMSSYLDLVLENGVEPTEISEIMTHLAFYSGWENATSAVAIALKSEVSSKGDRFRIG